MLTLDVKIRLTLIFLSVVFMLGSYTIMTEVIARRWYFRFLTRLTWLSLWVAAMISFQAALWPGDSL